MVVTVLAIGDIIGRPGREAVARLVPQLRGEFAIDLVVANGENAAGGFGLTTIRREPRARAGSVTILARRARS